MSHMFTTDACQKDTPYLIEILNKTDISNDEQIQKNALLISNWFNNNKYPRWDCHGALLRKFFELSKNGLNADSNRLKEYKFKIIFRINDKFQKIGTKKSKAVWDEQFAHRCADRYAQTGIKKYYKNMENYYKQSHILSLQHYRLTTERSILKYTQTSLYWLAWQYVRFQNYSKAKEIYALLANYSGPKYFYKHAKIILAKKMKNATISEFIEFRKKAQASHGLISNDRFSLYPD